MPAALARGPRDPRAAALLRFWFGEDRDDRRVAEQQRAMWFEHHPGHDREIQRRFGSLLDRAEHGILESWRDRSRPQLALIVLFDQLSRVIGRDTPRAFRNDARALELCREFLDTPAEVALRPIERVFLFLPLEHAEDQALQQESVARCEALAKSVPSSWHDTFENFAAYARRHEAVIRRFGRFPHRNQILGRVSTPEEIEFLLDPDASF